MLEPFHIRKIAVLGAGVMGAQIAAHCINAGIKTLLFDLKQPEQGNALIAKAIAQLKQLKPAPLALPALANLIEANNYEDDLSKLKDCDLVIEAIAERFEWKRDLYQRISPFLGPNTIFATNTSGLSIENLSQILPAEQRANFCGVHFFNPPRYMHLVELVPNAVTKPAVLDKLSAWLSSYLGKGVVRAKDTPNFIANRIGVYSMLITLKHAAQFDLTLDEVDLLTGSLLGRPKSATLRTMDVVGLDTLEHVVKTMWEQLPEDPWHSCFQLPSWLTTLIQNKALGQKTGRGIYRKNGKQIEIFDPAQNAYRAQQGELDASLKPLLQKGDILALASHPSRQAQFLFACFRDLFHYCAYQLPKIANSVKDLDLALSWGFGWKEGPFQTWQSAGFEAIKEKLAAEIQAGKALSKEPLPTWLDNISAFYGENGPYATDQKAYAASQALPFYANQFALNPDYSKKIQGKAGILYENEGVYLWELKDEVAVLSFKSKANTIDNRVIDGCHAALDKAEQSCQGLIVYQQDPLNFSSGADLRAVGNAIAKQRLSDVDAMLSTFQSLVQRLKYASIPTVAGLRGRALGGGCELMLGCQKIVAAFESYPGLVEVGVGLLPAGGGCTAFAMKAAKKAEQGDLFLFLKPYFQQIAQGFVANNALEAQEKGYLKQDDFFVMHAEEVLFAAFEQVQFLRKLHYQKPLGAPFKVAGRQGYARFEAELVNWLEGGFISSHDYTIALKIANILCGGGVDAQELVTEEWLLKLEKDAFMQLAADPLTQARIQYFLETGKILRN